MKTVDTYPQIEQSYCFAEIGLSEEARIFADFYYAHKFLNLEKRYEHWKYLILNGVETELLDIQVKLIVD